MKYLFFLLAIVASSFTYGQAVLCPQLLLISNGDTIYDHHDTVGCGTSCATLVAPSNTNLTATTTYSVSAVTYSPFSYTAGTDVLAGGTTMTNTWDDEFGDVITLPFNFCFFGTTFGRIVVGTNGNCTFNAGLANTNDPYPIGGPLPGSNCNATFNCIMSPWNDLYPPPPTGSGTIKYATYGTAPCRQFVMSWNNCILFIPSTCTDYTTSQIVLYESSNIIDIYIHHRTPCTGWNSGLAVTGIENAPGTLFYTPPGENGTRFTATDEGWRFTPTGTSSGWTYTWYDSTMTTVIGSGSDTMVVCPTVTSRYYVKAAAVACTGVVIWDSITLVKTNHGGGAVDSTAFGNPTSCISSDGWILLHGLTPYDTFTLTYTYNGSPVGPLTLYPDADSNLLFSSLPAGVYNNFIFTHDSCILGPYGPFTLVAPPIHISNETFTDPDICGQCNGSITLYGLLPGLPVTVNYSRDGIAQTPYTGVIGLDSTVHLNGLCAGSYTGIMVVIGSCSTDGTPIDITNPPPVPASFTFTTKLHCDGDEVIVTNTSTPAGYTAYWDFGDGSPIDSSGAIPLPHIYNDAATFIGNYEIKLTYSTYHTCSDTHTDSVHFYHPMYDSFAAQYTPLCVNTDNAFTNYSTSANSLTNLWDFGDGFKDTAAMPTHSYPVGGIFTTVLTITDSIGCKKTFAQDIEAISIDVSVGVHDTSACLRDSMLLRSMIRVIPDTVNFISIWTPDTYLGEDSAINNRQHSTNFLAVGTFVYMITATTQPPLAGNPFGCIATDTERIVSYPPVRMTNVTASPQVIAYGTSIQLNANGAVYYTWKPTDGTLSNPNINNPVATPQDSTTIYTVYGMNLYGCLDSAQVIIAVDFDMSEGIPTGFTPNGDGLNDIFRIGRLRYQKLVEFTVYNRWGQEVFRTSNPEKGWDGTFNGAPQDMGSYNYQIIVARPDGSNKLYKGTVILIR